VSHATYTLTPLCAASIDNEWIPSCSSDLKPVVGMKFDTLQQGINFYENYARVSGFDTQLFSTKKRKSNGKISLKYCVCNKEGFRETPRLHADCKKKRPITRLGCKTRITLKLINDQDNYVIFYFHEGHTHPLTTPNSAHHTKQSRNLTLAHKKYIMDNSRANIGATKSYRLMKEHVGGNHNMAASVTNFKNFQRDIRKHIRGKDVQMLIENFKRKQEMCSSFFFKYEVDDKQHSSESFEQMQLEGRIMHLLGMSCLSTPPFQ
ncbi:Protein FAR1-RELATED SEQUENCE 5, partial [Bienertia sinuspersici]